MLVGSMSGTHDEERALLRYTLSGHLNRTYIPHEAHDRIATLSSDIYLKERLSGVSAVSSLLVTIAESLESRGGMTQTDAFDGAFVNNWDVGNLVSDYLLQRLGGEEECECNSKFEGLPRAGEVGGEAACPPDLSSEFDRHKFLGSVMAGEAEPAVVNAVLRTCILNRLADSGCERVKMGGFEAARLEPLGEGCGPGRDESLEALEEFVLPDETDDPDGFDSMWELIKVFYGQDATQMGRRAGRDETGEGWTEFDARSAVVRSLCYIDFLAGI